MKIDITFTEKWKVESGELLESFHKFWEAAKLLQKNFPAAFKKMQSRYFPDYSHNKTTLPIELFDKQILLDLEISNHYKNKE